MLKLLNLVCAIKSNIKVHVRMNVDVNSLLLVAGELSIHSPVP